MGVQNYPSNNEENSEITITSQNRQWSDHFQQYVDDVDGVDVPGRRALVRFMDGTLVDLPASWVELHDTENNNETVSTSG